jgi:hypothetical protein
MEDLDLGSSWRLVNTPDKNTQASGTPQEKEFFSYTTEPNKYMKTKERRDKMPDEKTRAFVYLTRALQEIAGLGSGVISRANATTPPCGHPS